MNSCIPTSFARSVPTGYSGGGYRAPVGSRCSSEAVAPASADVHEQLRAAAARSRGNGRGRRGATRRRTPSGSSTLPVPETVAIHWVSFDEEALSLWRVRAQSRPDVGVVPRLDRSAAQRAAGTAATGQPDATG